MSLDITNFFKSKKRDLSNNSKESGESSKKLLLHDIEEESNENTDQRVIEVSCESMGETISIEDIERTHRLPGKKPKGKSRPVIVKFVRYNIRNLIFFKKKKNLRDQELV